MAINHISSGEIIKPTLFLEKKLRPQLKQFLDRLSGFVKSVDVSKLRKPLRCLDFGCGPSVWSALCLARIADEIVFAEYVTSNRKEVYKWLKHEKGCRDWSVASSLVGDLEKIPTRQVEERLRKKSCSVVPCDIHAQSIIQRPRKGSQSLCFYSGPDDLSKNNDDLQTPSNANSSRHTPSHHSAEFPPGGYEEDLFDIVLSSCCLECACFDELCYKKSVRRLAERTAWGGYLVLVGVMECPRCGPGRSFPRLSLTPDIIKQAVVSANCVVESFETFFVSAERIKNVGLILSKYINTPFHDVVRREPITTVDTSIYIRDSRRNRTSRDKHLDELIQWAKANREKLSAEGSEPTTKTPAISADSEHSDTVTSESATSTPTEDTDCEDDSDGRQVEPSDGNTSRSGSECDNDEEDESTTDIPEGSGEIPATTPNFESENDIVTEPDEDEEEPDSTELFDVINEDEYDPEYDKEPPKPLSSNEIETKR
ncbi:uncharacterized protein LOC100897609 [Galendromus occidentalis]|uniref:Uncharacterized protein LOC100897609 n=1 Tax=Galendromus occidentalis TaxID=34638 RepID=A0AAJ6VZZ9_9ACAR|nr:uncharacterized protein LOC100897609 [Galendromus occidentalis]